jgi:hypothetical protein
MKISSGMSIMAMMLALSAMVQAQFNYTTNNGAITITGYSGPGGSVNIPSSINGLPVVAIGDAAFQDRTNLVTVTIPNSVTNLGSRAFSGCSWLIGVNMPTKLPSIGDYTFWQCFQLTGITIPNTVTNIGQSAFYGCASLDHVHMPDTVKSIGDSAFEGCWRLTDCMVGSSLRNIGNHAFISCSNLALIVLPAGLTNVGDYAFAGCSRLGPVCFAGNAPDINDTAFFADDNATIHCTLGASGWDSALPGFSIGLWEPQVPCTFTTNSGAVQIIQYVAPGAP